MITETETPTQLNPDQPEPQELITVDNIPMSTGEQLQSRTLLEFHNDVIDMRVVGNDEVIGIERVKYPGLPNYEGGDDVHASWEAQQVSGELHNVYRVLEPAFNSRLAPLLRAMGYDMESEGDNPVLGEGSLRLSLPTVKHLNEFIGAHPEAFSVHLAEDHGDSTIPGNTYNKYVHERTMPVGVDRLSDTIHDLGGHVGFLFVSPMMMDRFAEKAGENMTQRLKVESDPNLDPVERDDALARIREAENTLTRVVDGYTSQALINLAARAEGAELNTQYLERSDLWQIGVELSDAEFADLQADIDEHVKRLVQLADDLKWAPTAA